MCDKKNKIKFSLLAHAHADGPKGGRSSDLVHYEFNSVTYARIRNVWVKRGLLGNKIK